MKTDQHIWQVWAQNLHRWGLKEWTASFLEAAGPFTLLGAQLIYLGQPLLGQFLPWRHLAALANLLEEPAQTQSFVVLLREGTSRDLA
jgi:hypothetical protein